MKQIHLNGKPTYYWICEDGVIYNELSHKNLKGTNKNNYIYFQLKFEEEIFSLSQHRLLAQYFIPNPNNYPVVHHKDHNSLNNSLSNLEWTTIKENTIDTTIRKDIKIFEKPITENEILTEEWRFFRDTHYQLSSLGRLKNTKTGNISLGSINKNSRYTVFSLFLNGKSVAFQAHRAVYEAFHPNEELKVIDHIDGVKTNNRINNLRNIPQRENVKHSVSLGTFGTAKPIGLYDDKGILKQVYPSISLAAKELIPQHDNSSVKAKILKQHIGTKEKINDLYVSFIEREVYAEFLENQH